MNFIYKEIEGYIRLYHVDAPSSSSSSGTSIATIEDEMYYHVTILDYQKETSSEILEGNLSYQQEKDWMVYFLADGDAEVSFQLAGVSAISGAVWEVGRLATKEKAPTREEYDRDVTLYKEFEEFANKRIIIGRGSCHRSDVINAFRRYNPKYRVADNEQYPLADIEIERILKAWNREFGSGSEMTSAGFVSGISVDGGADDIFA